MPRRGTTIHPSDIPQQSSNGNRGRYSSSFYKFFKLSSLPRMFRKTTVHPNIPVPIIENPIENPIEIPNIEIPIEIPIIEIANMWIVNPLIDPYNNKEISLSIRPKSRYVILYEKIMDALIDDIRGAFPQGYVLTIDDCKYIKNNLPIIHSIIDIPGDKYIIYDHLFIKYFVKKRRKYDKSYCEDSEIKLYLNIYNAIKRKNPTIKKGSANQSLNSQSFENYNYELIQDLLKNNMDLSKTDLSISKLVINMCIDVKYILYMYEPMITLENYKIALRNKKTLEYVASLYNAGFVTGYIYVELYYKDESITDQILSAHNREDIKEIYSKIISRIRINIKKEEKNLYDNNNILNKLIAIYDIILSLYARFFNKQIDPSILIKKSSQGSRKSSSKGSRKSSSQGSRKSSSKGSRKSSSQGSRKSSSKGSRQNLNPYCEKDVVDPITQDPIHELDEKDRKYVVSILSYNKDTKKINYYCFDTIEIYNYILTRIQETKEIKHPFFTNKNFTDDELDEICNKIKFLTKKRTRTYNSHVDIKEAYYENIANNIKLIHEKRILLNNKLEELKAELNIKKRLLEGLNAELNAKLNSKTILLGKLNKVLIQFKLKKEIENLKKEIENLKIKIENLKEEIEFLQTDIRIIDNEDRVLSIELVRLQFNLLKLHEEYKKKNKYDNYLKISFTYEFNENNNFRGIYNCFLTINLADIKLPIINIIRSDEEHSNKIFSKDIPYITMDNSFLVKFPIFKDTIKNDIVLNGIERINQYYIAKIGRTKIGKNDISFPYKRKNYGVTNSLKKIAHLPPFDFEMNDNVEEVFSRFQDYITRITGIQNNIIQNYIRRETDIENNINII